jgi:hypothetical protein
LSGVPDFFAESQLLMDRDIDYAAVAIEKAIVEKFGRQNDLQGLSVIANERTISIRHGNRSGEGTRDDLQALIRRADSYDILWQVLAEHGPSSSAK